MDARPPANTLSFNHRLREMRSIARTIRSISYHPIQDENLLALVEQIKQEISANLLACYGDEMNAKHTQPKSSIFGCFAFLQPHQDRHAHKIKMAELLYGICQFEFKSLLQINYFVNLLTEMKKSDEFIDPNHHRFHGIITSHQINLLMKQIRALVQSLNLSSNQNTSELYKKIFYLKIVKDEPNFKDVDDPVSQVLQGHDIRTIFGQNESQFIPLAYEGEGQLAAFYDDLQAARKNRLIRTLEYILIDGFKKKDLAHVIKYIAMMEVIYCFMDSLDIEQKKCAFYLIAHLNKDNALDAAVSNMKNKIDFCWSVIRKGGEDRLRIDGLCSALDSFKDAIHVKAPADPDVALDNFLANLEEKINEYANAVYLPSSSTIENLDIEARLDYREKKEGCNPHLRHHPEQMLLHQEWQKKIMMLSKGLLLKLRKVAGLTDDFFIPEGGSHGKVKVRDLDQLLVRVLEIAQEGQVVDVVPSVVHKPHLK